tara:strand:+ start:6590 stop:7942 length:1353 start_codon:yes stop_codon:yes gene_type:complete
MNTTRYQFNYTNFFALTSVVIFFGIITRSIAKTPAALMEYLMIFLLLFFSIIYIAQSLREQNDRAIIVYIFLIYLLLHSLVSIVTRPFFVDSTLYEVFFFTLSEFRVSTLGYFLPLLFLPLVVSEAEKIKRVLLILIKISIAYTLLEQIISLLGFRSLFETFYYSSGIVHEYYIGRKSFGLYRIWGFAGAPQLLGVFHIYTLIIMYIYKDKLWSILSVMAIIASTSKTAYLILILLAILYLIYNKHYLTILFAFVLFFLTVFQVNEFYNYLEHEEIQDYQAFRSFVQSIKGYFILTNNNIVTDSIEIVRNGKTEIRDFQFFVKDGPLIETYNYFLNNPIAMVFGKGITYSFMHREFLPSAFIPYSAQGSDFYFLTFIEQYGLIGFISMMFLFLIYPLYALFIRGNYHSFVLITFFLATLHYPPNVPKMMMLLVAYSIYKLYFINGKAQNA